MPRSVLALQCEMRNQLSDGHIEADEPGLFRFVKNRKLRPLRTASCLLIQEHHGGMQLQQARSPRWRVLPLEEFQERFGRPGKGNDKGKVEGLVATRGATF